jgi:hypothetical protein
MTATTRLLVVLALALGAATACSSDPSAMGDGPGGPGGGDDQPKPLDPTGIYTMHSTFDLATNMPGTAGNVVNSIIAATDDKSDPTLWILDQLIAQLPENNSIERGIKSALQFGEPAIADYLNGKLLDFAPDFVTDMVQVGHDFGDIAKHVGLTESFQLSGANGSYTAVHTVVGVHIKLDNQDKEITLATYRVPNVVVGNVAVTMDPSGQLTIAPHQVPLAYGQLLRLGLDAAIIPLIDANSHSLNDLLAHEINCQSVARAIVDQFGIGSVSALASACTAGLTAGANYLYSRIDAIDGTALQFSINGTARAVDKNNDRRIDAIQTGAWAGTLAYGSTPTPLLPATFFGERADR